MRIRLVVARGCFAMGTMTSSVATVLAEPSTLPDPADSAVAVPAVKYESAFSAYKPFREEKIRSWKEVNQEVAHEGMGSMGSMKDMPGKTMPGMNQQGATAPMGKDGAAGHDMASMKDMAGKTKPDMNQKAATAPMRKEGAVGHDMGSMKDMPGKAMPGMGKQAATAPMGKEGAAGHDMGSMKDMPGKAMPGMNKQAITAPASKESSGLMAMAKPQTVPGQSANAQTAVITGTGVVQGIDKANGKVRLTHDPIATLGWPKMTMVFRLKDGALVDQLKEGDKVEFSLEKAASGYVISGFQKGAASHDMKQMK